MDVRNVITEFSVTDVLWSAASVAEISDPCCHSVGTCVPAINRNLLSVKVIFYAGKHTSILFSPAI